MSCSVHPRIQKNKIHQVLGLAEEAKLEALVQTLKNSSEKLT